MEHDSSLVDNPSDTILMMQELSTVANVEDHSKDSNDNTDPSSQREQDINFNLKPDVKSNYLPTEIPKIQVNRPSNQRCQKLAVETKDLCFKFRFNTSLVLNDVSLKVPEGTIYGLLGPSGCGKTSLLRCILNQLKPASGSISIFSSHPGEPGSMIPGPGVGYMPQEVALIMEFTILETIRFFGKLHGMKQQQLQERTNFLLKFLDLPDGNRLVRDLSGGQRRRVSLAAALVHSPPLLVLDEPTVGVDPLLRETIWEHLVSLAEEEHMTIIITTHYIEEARRAPLVGFMRRGKLLVQDNPESIINRYELNSLETAFLKICSKEHTTHQEAGEDSEDEDAGRSSRRSSVRKLSTANSIKGLLGMNTTNSPLLDPNFESSKEESGRESRQSIDRKSKSRIEEYDMKSVKHDDNVEGSSDKSHQYYHQTFSIQCNIIKTVATKNLIKAKRNLGQFGFTVILPAIQVILFCLAIGQLPRELPVAVYNPDHPPPTMTHYSQNVLDQFDPEYIHLKFYDSLEEAIHSVESSKAWAAVEFPKNYSYWLDQRITGLFNANEQIINGSTIRIHADMTEYPIQMVLGQELIKAVGKFGHKLVNESNMIKFLVPWGTPVDVDKILSPPVIAVDPPVYGHPNTDYREFASPGFMISNLFAIACGIPAIALVEERNDGILERTLVAGVRSTHILLANVLVQFGVILLQTGLMFTAMFQLFDIVIKGSALDVLLLLILQGLAGMSQGFMISAICHNERAAWMATLAMFFPSLLLSGMIWPIQGMPYFLQVISYFLPQTMAIQSMRSIISRGLGITSWQVYIGFISSAGWTLAYGFLALIIFAIDLKISL